ncbi:MAG: ACT domain-containing protein [Acidimicrobiia bacterium]
MRTIGIGIAGAGTVGGTLIERLVADRAAVTARTGLDLEVRRVAVRDLARPRSVAPDLLTADVMELVDDDRVDLVVEVTPAITGGAGSFASTPTQWCLRLEVEDSPGVLAQIAGAFGAAGVSIKSVRQDGRGNRATLLMVTHGAPEAAQRSSAEALRRLDAVREVASAIRVEGDEA